jgi:carbon-monoxide dehydrogenase iron sulfur subunit
MTGMLKVNVGLCVGCKRCVLDCRVAHSQSKELLAAALETPPPLPRIEVVEMGGMLVPNQCRHCEDAPCIRACPEGALFRESPDGPVLVDEGKCKRHYACVGACPFHAIKIAEGGAIYKCDLCAERQKAGGEPACAEACLVGAITFTTAAGARAEGAAPKPVGASLARYQVTYEIDAEACTGCLVCAKKCTVKAISGEKKRPHKIDQAKCITCGECFRACRFDAVRILTAEGRAESSLLDRMAQGSAPA